MYYIYMGLMCEWCRFVCEMDFFYVGVFFPATFVHFWLIAWFTKTYVYKTHVYSEYINLYMYTFWNIFRAFLHI